MKTCSIDGCSGTVEARGWCVKHYSTWIRNGDPCLRVRKDAGEGTVNSNGYVVFGFGGLKTYEHIRIAEAALGKRLPPCAEVHHVDGDGSNNAPTNLVICPDHAYHLLLHKRQRALDACGDANFSRCWLCGTWSAPEALTFKKDRAEAFHATCWAAYQVVLRAKRKEKAHAV
jgi:hypothetical protein